MTPQKLQVSELSRIWRFYQAAIVNTVFGVSVYTVLVWFGTNMYIAHITSHVIGIIFNYFTYSRYTFAAQGSKLKFGFSYVANYVIGLAFLALAAQFSSNPYVCGLAAAGAVSVINYLVLSRFVFPVRVSD